MPFEFVNSEEAIDLRLTGKLGVQEAKVLWDALQRAAGAQLPIRVRAGELQDIDTSIIQILCRTSQGGHLQIVDPPTAFWRR